MSLSQSYLAQPAYGYDMVASVTQKALNNAIQTYYDDAIINGKPIFSPVSYYFIKNTDGTPLEVDLSGITVNGAGINVDPLAATVKTPLTQTQINTIKASNLWFAFNIYIGNPAATTENFLTINPGSNTVDYYLLCKTLHVAFWNPDNSTWVDIIQNTKNEFNINATVNLQTVTSNNNITTDVQNGIDYILKTYNLSNTDLNIQQLLFDADSAVVSPTSTLTGLDSSCSVFTPLMQQFAKYYFKTYLAQAPALDYAVTQNNTSSLLPTSMSLFTGAFVDSNGNPVPVTKDDAVADLSTINYLFSTNGDTLNPGKQLNWNFLDDNGSPDPDTSANADLNKYDGAIAINRNAFAKYLESKLTPYALQNCWSPIVVNEPLKNNDVFLVNFDQGKLLAEPFQPYSPFNGPSDQLLSYWSEDSKTAIGTVYTGDYMTVTTHFDMFVEITNANTITITQNLFLKIDAEINWNKYSGNPLDKTYTDVFNITVDLDGGVNFQKNTLQSTSADNSTAVNLPSPQGGWIVSYIQSLSAETFTDVPLTMPQQFVFPGGNAFTFKDAQFSEYSDLVCHVKYLAED